MPEATSDVIAAPAVKASAALGSAAGANIMAAMHGSESFLPQDLVGWISAGAGLLAGLYSLTLLCEWWWKRVIKKHAIKRGWIDHTGPAPLR